MKQIMPEVYFINNIVDYVKQIVFEVYHIIHTLKNIKFRIT